MWATTEYPYSRGPDETTTTFNFTRAFDGSLRNNKPKRRERTSVHFAIHEDSASTQNVGRLEDNTYALSRPARRVTGSFARSQLLPLPQSVAEPSKNQARPAASRLSQAPRRPPGRLSIVPESAVKSQDDEAVGPAEPDGIRIKSARPMRRRTIYIPNDDTTMPSMFMGVFSPLQNFERSTESNQELTTDLTGIAAQMAAKRGRNRRVSIMDAAPRRAPLQASVGVQQDINVVHDRVGQGGGKENFPPGVSEQDRQARNGKAGDFSSSASNQTSVSHTGKDSERFKARRASVYASTTTSLQRTSLRHSPPSLSDSRRHAQSGQKRPWNSGGKVISNPAVLAKTRYVSTSQQPLPSESISAKATIPSRFIIPTIEPEPMSNAHIILPNDIPNATLYEEQWLGHQEIALTQLINKLFTSAKPAQRYNSVPVTLTQELLEVYNSDNIALLHNRIQAAMLYGALSIPQEVLDQGEIWAKDIGRKQRFIRLWLDNYDRDALEAGLEVITGRCCRSQAAHASNSSSPSKSATRRVLSQFIDSFLIRNEDNHPEKDCRRRAWWSYQRTMLRSLMLIKALDMIKTAKLSAFNSRLFLLTASHKSSTSILQAFFQMMNPAAGDPERALGHIDYRVSHVQYPLEEFAYSTENLAVDLRDGVRLTRLVELLLYPTASRYLESTPDAEATTIVLPAGDFVCFQEGQDWPLSQHLKLPCLSRAARLWNVEVALSALVNVRGTAAMLDGITAEDVVDGFREKTIRLLWALVGRCGLPNLIDWEDVKWETRRLLHSSAHPFAVGENDQFDVDDHVDGSFSGHTFESCKSLLKDWVRAVAASQGIQVRNFTTDFANGRIFQSIIDTYERFLPPSTTAVDGSEYPKQSGGVQERNQDLCGRLLRLGCSQQFSELFATASHSSSRHSSCGPKGHIFHRDFVLASLAFLCSRFLSPTKAVRAAVVIQQCWRKHWMQIEARRNKRRKQVAMACAEHVRLKTKHHENEERCENATSTSEAVTDTGFAHSVEGPGSRSENSDQINEEAVEEEGDDGTNAREDSSEAGGGVQDDIWLSL